MLQVRAEFKCVGLEPGESLLFGRGSADRADALGIGDDPRLHRDLGRIDARADGWQITNLRKWLHLSVVSLDGKGIDQLAPRDRRLIQWGSCRVEVDLGERRVGFEVVGDEAPDPGTPEIETDSGSGSDTERAFQLDRGSGYFRALVALVSRRLEVSATQELLSNAEIAWVLSRCASESGPVTIKSVERRLAHCAQLCRVGAPVLGDTGGSSRERLADTAIATSTVTRQDLRVLRERCSG